MRFRRIEKDMGGMANVGLKDQHIQGKEDDVTTSESKTYIGSNAKKKVAMNKIKNTKIGDDIHYYINGQEGRGIVVKMANEYLEVFKEDGQLGTIHINDTFFVKDILINKQWDDMDDTERYEALTKIHAPSPRYIAKAWSDIPEEIKVLLQKEGGNMAGGAGSTYEQGESKDSETQDHSRTGFAQNAQYAEKVNYKPRWKDPETGAEDFSEESYRYEREAETEKHKEHMQPSEHIGHPDYFKKEKNPFWNKRVATDPNKLDSKGVPYGKGHHKVYHPDDPVSDHTRRKGHKDNYVRAGHEAKLRAKRQNQQNIHTGEADYEAKYQKYKTRRSGYDKAKKVVTDAEDKQQKNLRDQWAKDHPEPKHEQKPRSDSCPTCGNSHPGLVHEKKPDDDDDDWENPMSAPKTKALYKQWLEKKVKRPSPRTAHGSFGTTQSEAGQEAQSNLRSGISGAVESAGIDFGTASTKARPSPRTDEGGFGTTHHQRAGKPLREAISSGAESLGVDFGTSSTKSDDFRKLKPVYEGDTKQAKDTRKAYEVWLERQAKSHDNPSRNVGRGKRKREPELLETDKADDLMAQDAEHGEKVRENIKIRGEQKSDVEHGRYGSVGGTHNVAVSTDTKYDIPENTGYEERPHISVEEAGKLPRGTFNPHGNDELHVRGSQDSKDEPKFSQPADQEQPVRKAGLPQQHPNTYGVRYGMKGGVKKVWCPEHQMWEETTKDWHDRGSVTVPDTSKKKKPKKTKEQLAQD